MPNKNNSYYSLLFYFYLFKKTWKRAKKLLNSKFSLNIEINNKKNIKL